MRPQHAPDAGTSLPNRREQWRGTASRSIDRADPERASRALQLARRHLKQRRLRGGIFGNDLFREPAWDIMLELYCAWATGREISIMEAIIAAGVPNTTGLRHLERLIASGHVTKCRDVADRRRSWVELSDDAAGQIEAWLLASWPEYA
jgi:DNA-binding MarR family transcriptional regulator